MDGQPESPVASTLSAIRPPVVTTATSNVRRLKFPRLLRIYLPLSLVACNARARDARNRPLVDDGFPTLPAAHSHTTPNASSTPSATPKSAGGHAQVNSQPSWYGVDPVSAFVTKLHSRASASTKLVRITTVHGQP